MITTILLTAALVGDIGTPGKAWEPCGEVCTYGATCPLECEDDLHCMELDGATICVPECNTDADCQGYDPAPPKVPAGAQCWGDDLDDDGEDDATCILQCGLGDEAGCGDTDMKCVPYKQGEGACMGEPTRV